MEDYRRLVSYIYTYVNGEKNKNVGFAKIEVRGNELRMRISVRVNEESSGLVVYGYSFRRGEYGLHILGEMSVEQGFCNATFQKFQTELTVDFHEIKGLYICPKEDIFDRNNKKNQKNLTKNIIYGSEWTDIPIEVEDFRQLLATEWTDNNMNDADSDLTFEEVESSTQCVCEPPTKQMCDMGQQVCEPPAKQMCDMGQEMCEPPAKQMCDMGQEMCEPPAKQMCDMGQEMCEPPAKQMCDMGQEMCVPPQKRMSEGQPEMSKPEECTGEYDQESECDDSICEASKDDNMIAAAFTKLGALYPKVHINELTGECIQITPHDIKFLPRKFWQLENNSFLLHGYYNYRHIIIWKRAMGGEVQYILGVPGLFHPREQTIAHMFGFPAFEGNRRGRGINFGYWCVRLD